MGKGDTRRPCLVDTKTVEDNWARTFGIFKRSREAQSDQDSGVSDGAAVLEASVEAGTGRCDTGVPAVRDGVDGRVVASDREGDARSRSPFGREEPYFANRRE